MANVYPDIVIGSKFDGKGFKQADTALTKLNKNIKNLATTFGLAYGTQAVIEFGKQSVKAFTDTQKAITQLSNTTKNLGLSFATQDIIKFTQSLSIASGVADEQLLPGMQKLLQVTGSVTQSQKLLATAIDISKGSGVDFSTTVGDLANAYVGNNKGLKKYALGLTAAELKTATFDKVLKAFNRNFAGASQANLQTTAGKMELLGNAAHEASVIIGGGLVDAFSQIAGGGSVSGASQAILTFADAVAALERGTGSAIGVLPNLFDKIKQAGKSFFFGAIGKQFNVNVNPNPKPKEDLTAKQRAAAIAKAEADAKKREAEIQAQILKSQKALTAQQKQAAILKKNQSVFDMQNIELLAALQGNLTKDEQDRVKALLALNNDNAAAAQYYTDLVLKAQDATGALANLIRNLPTAKNPFADWQIPAAVTAPAASVASALAPSSNGSSYITSSTAQFPTTELGTIVVPQSNVPATTPSSGYSVSYNPQTGLNYQIQLMIDGKQVAAAMNDQSLNGNQIGINRSSGTFG